MKIISEVNNQYTANVIYSKVTFYYQGNKIGATTLQDGVPEARKVLRYLAITMKPFYEVLCFHRLSQQLLGADVLEMSVSDNGEDILHAGKVIGKLSEHLD